MTTEERLEKVKKCLRTFPDFPKKGILFHDIFPLMKHPDQFADCINLMVEHIQSLNQNIDVVIGLEARGFIFGPMIAQRLGCSFSPIRKAGKLPGPCIEVKYNLEYGSDVFEAQEDAAKPGQKAIIVDDLLATGGTMAAACQLMKQMNIEVVECLVLIELGPLNGRSKIPANIHSMITYNSA